MSETLIKNQHAKTTLHNPLEKNTECPRYNEYPSGIEI